MDPAYQCISSIFNLSKSSLVGDKAMARSRVLFLSPSYYTETILIRHNSVEAGADDCDYRVC